MDYNEVINEVFSKLMKAIPTKWDGRSSIEYMKNNGCHNWKQMEWPGWYFQFMCENVLSKDNFFSIPGPIYGKVEFDGFKCIPWDFKAHSSNSGTKVPTNGYDEICKALLEYDSVGFIIAKGEATFDDPGQSFKKWHDSLKGRTSIYELQREMRGAKSRRRKTSFLLEELDFIVIKRDTLKYCGSFQKGMINSNGAKRNPKVMLDLSDPRLERHVFKVSNDEKKNK
ncbi:MAG: hypothetical protein PHF91_01490 [Bacilli bacterium]|nr:hypothetical protein [Bacilli bacterium]